MDHGGLVPLLSSMLCSLVTRFRTPVRELNAYLSPTVIKPEYMAYAFSPLPTTLTLTLTRD
jgi:hypothetical protein